MSVWPRRVGAASLLPSVDARAALVHTRTCHMHTYFTHMQQPQACLHTCATHIHEACARRRMSGAKATQKVSACTWVRSLGEENDSGPSASGGKSLLCGSSAPAVVCWEPRQLQAEPLAVGGVCSGASRGPTGVPGAPSPHSDARVSRPASEQPVPAPGSSSSLAPLPLALLLAEAACGSSPPRSDRLLLFGNRKDTTTASPHPPFLKHAAPVQ